MEEDCGEEPKRTPFVETSGKRASGLVPHLLSSGVSVKHWRILLTEGLACLVLRHVLSNFIFNHVELDLTWSTHTFSQEPKQVGMNPRKSPTTPATSYIDAQSKTQLERRINLSCTRIGSIASFLS